jgi:hypothetical protein
MDYDWPDFPVILGQGSLHSLSAPEDPPPRLWGMKSVSEAGARGLHRPVQTQARKAGFAHHLVRERK